MQGAPDPGTAGVSSEAGASRHSQPVLRPRINAGRGVNVARPQELRLELMQGRESMCCIASSQCCRAGTRCVALQGVNVAGQGGVNVLHCKESTLQGRKSMCCIARSQRCRAGSQRVALQGVSVLQGRESMCGKASRNEARGRRRQEGGAAEDAYYYRNMKAME
eukprot:1158062-Pelagomonas_calceolata.AAC.3